MRNPFNNKYVQITVTILAAVLLLGGFWAFTFIWPEVSRYIVWYIYLVIKSLWTLYFIYLFVQLINRTIAAFDEDDTTD